MGILDKIKGSFGGGDKEDLEIPEFGPSDLDMDSGLGTPKQPSKPSGPPSLTPPQRGPSGGSPQIPKFQEQKRAQPRAGPRPPSPGQRRPQTNYQGPSRQPPRLPDPSNLPAPGNFPQPQFPKRSQRGSPIPDDTSRKLDMILDKLGNIEERISYMERALYGQQ